MIDTSAILARLDDERRRLARTGEIIDILPHVTRLCAGDGSHRTIIYCSLNDADADTAIQQEIEFHRRLCAGFEWKVFSHDRPADLRQRLERRGLCIGPREAVLAFDLVRAPPWWKTPGAIRVERADRLEHVEIYRRVANAIFGKDYSFTARQLAEAIEAGSTDHRGYIAWCGEEPVSIGRLYTHEASSFGGLYGGGTVPEYRGRGYYRAVIAARARDAIEHGARHLIVDALPTSQPILERLGFECVAETWPATWPLPGVQ